MWWQQKLALFATKASKKEFTGSRKGRHSKTEENVLKFVRERRKNGQPVTSDTTRNKAKEEAEVLEKSKQVSVCSCKPRVKLLVNRVKNTVKNTLKYLKS